VNHRILERKWHPRDLPRACPFERRPQKTRPRIGQDYPPNL